MDIKTYKQQLLDELYAPYKKCLSCPLGSLGRTQVVFGEGNPDATLMFIGEGPGQEEDRQGKPFVGRSGQLLTKVLLQTGLQRADVFITNIVKCRPPNNRTPLPNEAAICKNLLLRNQIKIVRPKIICTLGACALQELLEKSFSISRVRGTDLEHESTIVVPTFHPAYVLRNPPALKEFAQDIFMVVERSKKLSK